MVFAASRVIALRPTSSMIPGTIQYLLSAGISAPQFGQRILAILLALLKLIDILLLDP